ncbi:MAG TPA: hypothetical protein VMU27_02625 [Candidatus Paceibacterota bacterium]|nr:hypothetical protein [Candidatus Paceibacterota bacterium]
MLARWWKYKVLIVFILTFAIACAVHIHYAMRHELIDQTVWANAVDDTALGGIFHPPHNYGATSIIADPAYLYPGTTILMPAVFLYDLGLSDTNAIRISFSVVLALFIALACAASIAFFRKPSWSIPLIAVLLFGAPYIGATLGSALTIPLFVLLMILFSAIVEARSRGSVPAQLVCGTGIAGGLALASRLDMSAIFLGTGLVMLWMTDRKSALSVALISFASFFLFDPFAWSPIRYILILHSEMMRQEHISFMGASFWAENLVLPYSLWPLAFASAGILLIFRRTVLPIPPRVISWIIVAMICTVIVIFSASSRRPWYFSPYIILWEVLLLPIVGSLIDALPLKSARASDILQYFLAGGLAFVFTYPFNSNFS